MSHRPWPGDETGRAKLTSSELALQEQPVQPVQPVQPHRDTPVRLSQWSGWCDPLQHSAEAGLSRHFGMCWEAVQMCMWTRIQPPSSLWQQLPGLVVAHGAGGCPWAWWISTTLTTAYIPTLRFSAPSVDWPSSVCCAAMRSGPPPLVSIGSLPLISLIVGSKPKSQLLKFYIDVMNTWQHK